MFSRNNSNRIVISWMFGLIVCLAFIMAGGFILTNIWRIGSPGVNLGRLVGGIGLVVLGIIIGYIGTLNFFWAMVNWISKNEFKTRPGKSVKGPKIVVIGGGTGLGTILRGLKEITSNLTAIVTVADDGGSSGRLRREFGILPPGDIRSCLVAMADLEPLMERLMQYRFSGGSNLAGHNFGNLFLTAMTGITGDFEDAIKASSKVLAVRGQVLPATLEHVVLNAELADGTTISGESQIAAAIPPIKRVYLEPTDSKPVPEAIIAINEADLIILGPGSLYTSIIPNLLVKEIAVAIRKSTALKLYICNAMTQPGETDDHTASDHVKAIINHAGPGLIDLAVVNIDEIPADILKRYAEEGGQPVKVDLEKIRALGITPLAAEIIIKANVIRHDAGKLAELVAKLAKTKRFEHLVGKMFAKHIFRAIKGFAGILFTK